MRYPNLNILRPAWRPHKPPPLAGMHGRWQQQRQVLLDHFGLVAGLLLVACAMLWAAGEHSRHKAELRAAETSRLVAEFRSAPVAGAWQRLAGAWAAQRPRQEALLQRIATLSGAPLHGELRHYRAFVIDTVMEQDLAPDIDTMIQFYRRLAACLRIGACDAAFTAGLFGNAAWSFRNQHYYYLLEECDVDEIDRVIDSIAPRAAADARAASS
jgi:hypothetical protein